MGRAAQANLPAAVLLMRLVVLSCFLAMPLILSDQAGRAFYGLIGVGFLVTIPYSIWLRSPSKTARFAPLQFLVDLVWVTGAVYFTGGIESPLVPLYLLIIVSGGLIAGTTRSLQMTLLSALSYAIMVLLVAQGVVPSYQVAVPPQGIAELVTRIALTLFLFFCVGLAASALSAKYDQSLEEIERFLETAKIMFNRIQIPMLIVDPSGVIRDINPATQEMLGIEPQDLLGKAFRSLVASEFTSVEDDQRDSVQSCLLRRADGSYFAASIDLAPLESSLPEQRGHQLMVIHDISGVLKDHTQAHRTDRNRTIENILHILADGIRNPLAAISGSLEMLGILDSKGPLSTTDQTSRSEVYQCALKETERLVQILDQVSRTARFSPEELDALFLRLKQDSHSDTTAPLDHPA